MKLYFLAQARLAHALTTMLWALMAALLMVPAAEAAPILVVKSASSLYGNYYGEILRTEGLNAFDEADISTVTPAILDAHDVVLLAKMPLTSAQATMFSDWVGRGGNLIAMAPASQLAGLLGITATGTFLSNGYMLVDSTTPSGRGITSQTLQFHGQAERYTLNGAAALATLYTTASASAGNPAVTLRSVGSGKAAAFAYDLATSVVLTRQGNPAWAAQERDGFAPIRSDDKFYGAAAGDPQPDWVDLTKVTIPQADEQQRLLANLILQMNQSKKPLPRFWYFPNGKRAVVIMTGDDHGNNGTAGRFDQFLAKSPAGCSLANWECVRGTSYIYPNTPLTNTQAANYAAQGFEIGLHVNTGCADFTPTSLESFYTQQIADFQAKYTRLPALATQRHHCIVWSDWVTGAKVQLKHGMRLDVSYYFWPAGWVKDVPGVFTGSAMPMRFADLDGTVIDVYEAATQMTDESGQTYPATVDALLDRALGPEQYFGAYVVNAHTDVANLAVSDAVVDSALSRGVPIVSAQQMLTWLDGRNGSSFNNFAWSGTALSFSIAPGSGATGLQAMVPLQSATGVLTQITRNGAAINFTPATIKGIGYGMFAASAGTYVATYGTDSTLPTVTARTPADNATGVSVSAPVTVTFSEGMDPATINGSTLFLRTGAGASVAATVSYDPSTSIATLRPSSTLAGSTTYIVTVKGGATDPRVKDLAGNALASDVTWSFTTGAGVSCSACSIWANGATPSNAAANDSGAVELGVKFRSDVSGYITGIRFYKGAGNTGAHVGNLWSAAGTRLATANFNSETASGWQQVNFQTPVAIAANTTYIASYFAPAGHYAFDSSYFASTGVDNGPLHALSNGAAAGNGVYVYSASSAFPSSTYQSTNYWVDVVFSTGSGSGGGDTVPPTVAATSPVNNATGVDRGAAVTATFSEAMDPASIGGSSFQLRDAANALVPASVAYNSATWTATLTPASPLAASTRYTALVSGAKDLAGNSLGANFSWVFTTAGVSTACSSPANPIVAENCLPGSPASEWDIAGAGDLSIQGFATDISVNRGGTVNFKVNTNARDYRFDIYRMGYYGGAGARKVASVLPSAALPQNQPNCLNDTATGLIDCGNWAVSGSWTVPASFTSGIYFAKLVRADTGGASHIFFVVRDDGSTSDAVFQTSDTTWQAYNDFGGNSLYTGNPVGRAYKVSYNRPFNTRNVDNGQDWVFNSEYPMVRWLEANGYNVSYITGVDSERAGSLIKNHKLFLSVGHDEYWSAGQRANVEAARNAGVNLAFFSGNEVFWKTRWEASIDGSNTPYRTLVSYKETHANQVIDPADPPIWTGTWRDPRFSPPADGGRPENALTGTLFMVNDGATTAITVPAEDGKMRFWRNTSIASLAAGTSATLPNGTLGYEWDLDVDNGSRPAGLFRLSTTTVNNAPLLQDYGSTYGSGTAVHSLTLYRHGSGALVFGSGTVQWPWGLDANHDRAGTPADSRMQQATVNLLADMGVQPATLQSGLAAATASSDKTAPVSAITSPAAGTNLPLGSAVTIKGTASDTGGVVGGVEVSTDGGTTWHPASGRSSWTYTWTPAAAGNVTIKSRAVDDSGNIETPNAGVAVSAGGVDTTPPASPGGLQATPTATGVALSWAANTEADLAGYNVYRSTSAAGPFNTRINGGLLTTPAFQDAQAALGTSYYVVTAVDKANNESSPSAVASATRTASNLLQNPGFEVDANADGDPDGWTSSPRVMRSNASVHGGSYSMRHSATNNASYTISQTVANLAGGKTYDFSGWVNIPATADAFTFSLQLRWRNGTGGIIRTDTVKPYSGPTGGWVNATASLLAPTGAASADVLMVVNSLNATAYVDDFDLRER